MLEWHANLSYLTVGRPQWFLMEIGSASSVYLRATCALVISCNASRKLEIMFLWRSKVGNYGRCGDMTWHDTYSVFWRILTLLLTFLHFVQKSQSGWMPSAFTRAGKNADFGKVLVNTYYCVLARAVVGGWGWPPLRLPAQWWMYV